MTGSDIWGEYLDWLTGFVRFKNYCERYSFLLDYLADITFYWSVDHDENRSEDGIALRSRFAYERGYGDEILAPLPPYRCSLLEMMIALAERCADELYYTDEGFGTEVWFWEMAENMGLMEFDDRHFDPDECDAVVDRFLERQYERDGSGGLFHVQNPAIDMRKAEIWYQMNTRLSEIFGI